MSNISLIIEERAARIGKFLVGRLLPFRQKRSVGPFVFIDHMGPATMGAEENLDVPPHPHIGLSTLTYLFEGAILHRDSTGVEMEISPSAVNWMTAGKGVVHSERTPVHLHGKEKRLHGLQIWVALPKELEQCEPSFYHAAAESLPVWQQDGLQFKLIAGQLLGQASPVPVHSPLYLLEIKTETGGMLNLGDDLFGEAALYILEGGIQSEGNLYQPKQILIADDSQFCQSELLPNSSVYIFGGEPLPEERFIYWNFVSSDKNLIEQAKEDWQAQRFPKVPNETEFVPLPKY